MSIIKDIGAAILAYGGANAFFGFLTGAYRRDIILVYHRVLPDDWRETELPVDRSQRYVTASEFGYQLRFLSKRRRPSTLNEIIEGTDEPSFAVTFDDGYEDNFSVAAPILRELSIPATVFVTTDVISGNEFFWWERLGNVLWRGSGGEFEYNGVRYILESEEQIWETVGVISSAIKRLSERDEIIADIEKQLGVTAELPRGLYMNWEQVKALYDEGWEIGSHSSRHTILTTIPFELACSDIDDSIAAIGEHLGSLPRYFAYPNGRFGDFNEEIINHLKDRGTKAAVTMIGGPVQMERDDFRLPRAAPRRGETNAILRLRLTGLYDRLTGI